MCMAQVVLTHLPKMFSEATGHIISFKDLKVDLFPQSLDNDRNILKITSSKVLNWENFPLSDRIFIKFSWSKISHYFNSEIDEKQ